MIKQPLPVAEIASYEAALSDVTVVRLTLKVMGCDNVLDLRVWRTDRNGKRYPSHKGICFKPENWKTILKLFKDNGLPYDTETNS